MKTFNTEALISTSSGTFAVQGLPSPRGEGNMGISYPVGVCGELWELVSLELQLEAELTGADETK